VRGGNVGGRANGIGEARVDSPTVHGIPFQASVDWFFSREGEPKRLS